MSTGGGALPPIKHRGLWDSPPKAAGAKGPPKGPGGGPGVVQGSDDGWGTVGSTSTSKGRGRSRKSTPPREYIAASAAIIPLTLWLGPISRTGAVVVGMFVGVAVLGFTRLEINRRISGGRYADWSIPAARVATALFVAGWAIGALSMWRLAIEFSRRFT